MFSFINDLYQGVLNVQAVLYVISYFDGRKQLQALAFQPWREHQMKT
jgi:hypothetical protein